MLKVLVVDDEKNIRDGLKTIIEWEKYGFKICGEAVNGKDGLKQINELKPDLAIVDLKMPVINGLEMIKQLHNNNIKCKTIILSGYSEFEYAKKAIGFGVSAYILKPIDEDELIKEVKKIYKKVFNERSIEESFNNSIKLSQDKIIEKLLIQPVDKVFLLQANKLYKFNFPWKAYQIILIDVDKNISTNLILKNNIKNVISKYIMRKNLGYVFNIEKNIGILLKDIYFNSISFFNSFKSVVKMELNIDIIVAVGERVKSIDKLFLSYQSAYKLLNKKFIYGDQKVLIYNEHMCRNNVTIQTHNNASINDIIIRLYTAIDVNNKKAINDILENAMLKMMQYHNTEEEIKGEYINIYINVIKELIINNQEFKSYECLSNNVLNNIYKKTNLKELHQYVKDKLTRISNELIEKRPEGLINKIIDYIYRNYDKDIKLELLAQIFNYNSAYLGKQFKKYTGKYFNVYLDLVRINKGKELLKQGMKVYEVAERLGYKDTDYFSSKFKKYTGTSPSYFKKS